MSAREKFCPKCGADVTDSYQGDEPDVGVVGGWYCDACELPVPQEDDPFDADDELRSRT